MINLKMSVDKLLVLINYKVLRKIKDYYISFRLFLKKLVNRLPFKVLNYIKRYIRNLLKLFLSFLYRLKLHFIANKMLYVYRTLRRKNTINYYPELKLNNNITLTRLDFHFKYSIRAQERYKEFKSAIKNIKANNM